MPGAEAHEHLHFAVNRFKFDPERILEHGPTRVAVMEARSRGFVKSSDSDAKVIREVMTRIWAHEHGTLKVSDETADKIAAHFLANATPAAGALDTLEELPMKAVKPQSGEQNNGALTLEQRAEGERNLVRSLVIAKKQGVSAAIEDLRRMRAEKRAKDRNSPDA